MREWLGRIRSKVELIGWEFLNVEIHIFAHTDLEGRWIVQTDLAENLIQTTGGVSCRKKWVTNMMRDRATLA